MTINDKSTTAMLYGPRHCAELLSTCRKTLVLSGYNVFDLRAMSDESPFHSLTKDALSDVAVDLLGSCGLLVIQHGAVADPMADRLLDTARTSAVAICSPDCIISNLRSDASRVWLDRNRKRLHPGDGVGLAPSGTLTPNERPFSGLVGSFEDDPSLGPGIRFARSSFLPFKAMSLDPVFSMATGAATRVNHCHLRLDRVSAR